MGKSIYEIYETSVAAENDGQWFSRGLNTLGKDHRFCLARVSRSNKKYTTAIGKMHDVYGKQVETGTLADDTATELLLEIFCTTVLLDWENIQDREGNLIPFSTEAAVKLLTDLPDLYADLEREAKGRENYLQVQKEVDSGN